MALFKKGDVSLPLVTQAMQVDTESESEMRAFWARCSALADLSYSKQYKVRDASEYTKSAFEGTTYTPAGPEAGAPYTEKKFVEEVYIDADGEPLFTVDESFIVNVLESQADKVFTDAFGHDTRLLTEEDYGRAQSAPQQVFNNFVESCRLTQQAISTLCDRKVLLLPTVKALRDLASIDHVLRPDLAQVMDYSQSHNMELPEEWPIEKCKPGSYLESMDSTFAVVAAFEETLLAVWKGESFLNRCDECDFPFVASRRSQKFCSYRCSARNGERRRRSERKNVRPPSS